MFYGSLLFFGNIILNRLSVVWKLFGLWIWRLIEVNQVFQVLKNSEPVV